MARSPAAPEFAILDISLAGGLAQKSDPRLLPMGQSANATNVVFSKQGSLQKTQGLASLGTTNPVSGETALTIPRIASHNYGLATVATASGTGISGVWTRVEAGNNLFLNDRISEVYIPPTDGVLDTGVTPVEIDTCVCVLPGSPYELHVADLTYSVTQCSVDTGTASTTRSFVVSPGPIIPLVASGTLFTSPKLVLVNGSVAILTVHEPQGFNIWATSLDMTHPWLGWSAIVQLSGAGSASGLPPTIPDLHTYGQNTAGVYDTCATDEPGVAFLLAYQSDVAGVFSDIVIASFTFTFNFLNSGQLPDLQLTASGNALSAIAVRASTVDGSAWVAYAYSARLSTAAIPFTVVNAGALVYPSLASVFSLPIPGGSTDLTNGVNGYPAPQLIDIKKIPVLTGHFFPQSQQVVWSPPQSPVGPVGSATLNAASPMVGSSAYNSPTGPFPGAVCTAIYQSACFPHDLDVILNPPYTTTIHPNQPRWTNNVLLASRMATVTNAAGATHAYMVGWIPSNSTIPGATSITSVAVANAGGFPGTAYAINGIVYQPTVTVTGGGGSGAQVAVTVDNSSPPPIYGTITGATIVNPGSGYTTAPTVNLTFGTGAVILPQEIFVYGGGSGSISSILVTPTGSGYSTVPNSVPILVTDETGEGSGFVGWAIVNAGGQVIGVNIISGGVNYSSNPPGGPYTLTAAVQAHGTGGSIVATIPTRISQNIQGTFYLFCMDTFADINSTQSESVNVPLRMCGLWKPRLAKLPLGGASVTASGNGTIVVPHSPHVLTHFVPGANGPLQTDLPIQVSAGLAVSTTCSADLGSEYNYQPGELGGLGGFAGGLPCLYDGARTADFAFPYYPENIVVNPVQGVDSQIPPGTYQYMVIYTRLDAQGNVHRSGRSVQATVVIPPLIAGGSTNLYRNQLLIPYMSFSTAQRGQSLEDTTSGISAQSAESIEVYRTINGGTQFYNINNIQAPTIANSIVNPYLTLFDNTLDSDLINNPLLYGDGLDGIVPTSSVNNLCPPPLQGLIVHKNRWWGYDGNSIWYSKAFTDGEGPGFNELFAFSVDDGPGNITALAAMDERLIIFKRDRIFYVTGDGPSDNLTQNDLQPPQRIQSDVGCINWRSVVGTPAGTWFQSDNGLYVLTRKMEVQPSGKFVEDVLDQYSDITSATLDMRNGLVVFSANQPNVGGPVNGILILYSWVLDTWTTQQIAQPNTGFLSGMKSACLSGPNLAYTLTDGGTNLYRQTTGTGPGSYLSDGAYQSLVWESPWARAPSVQGWMRVEMVHLFWQTLDPHLMQVSFAYNFSNVYSETWTVSAAAQAAVVTPYVQWDFQPINTQVESMRIRVTDLADATIPPVSGQGPLVIGCTVEYTDLGGTFRKSISQRGNA